MEVVPVVVLLYRWLTTLNSCVFSGIASEENYKFVILSSMLQTKMH